MTCVDWRGGFTGIRVGNGDPEKGFQAGVLFFAPGEEGVVGGVPSADGAVVKEEGVFGGVVEVYGG